MKLTLRQLTAALALAALSSTAHAVLIDFNDSSDLSTFFNATGNTSAITVPFPNNVGLNNSGSIAPSTFFVTGAQVFNQGFQGNSSAFSMSLYFKFDNPTGDADFGTGLYMGFGPSDSYSPSLGATVPNGNHFLVGFQPRTTTGATMGNPITKYAMFLQEKVDGSITNSSFTTLTNDLVLGNWYFFEMQFTYDVDGYDISAQVYDAASDGTVGSALAGGAVSGSDLTNATLSDGSDVYAFIGASGGGIRGFANVDNFSLIPEPTSAALLFGALGLGAWRRRRSS